MTVEAIRRLKAASSASTLRESALSPGESAFDPSTPGTAISSEISDPSSSTQPLRWYEKVRRVNSHNPQHPYELKAISLQSQGPEIRNHTCVEFWPYVGPLAPKTSAAEGRWTDWEGCAALVGANKLSLGRCTDEDPWDTLWELTIPNDELFHVTWTYHPFSHHPLIVTGGKLGLIYIIDAVTKTCIRILRGHGDVGSVHDILCLTFHLAAPHILASASSDKTVRIWNILGSDPTPPDPRTGDKLSENFPMAMADEGNVIVAVLAGEGSGGHRSKVVGAAFHPKHRAIATCGTDYCVKIWPLPPLPDPYPNEPLTPKGYRPKVIHFPLFSTARMFENFVDSIQWLSDDILMSRSQDVIITWHWLAFRRFFRVGQYEAIYAEPQRTDFNDSHSFMVISRYPIKMDSWYFRPGLHHAFRPTPSEIPKFEANPNLVLDILIAMGVAGMHPEIQLFNPSLAKPDAPPEPDIELRYKSDEEGINAADKSEGSDHGDEGSKKRLADQQIVDTMSSGVSAIKLAFPGPTPPQDPQSSDEGLGPRKKTKTDETKRNTERKRKNPSLVPWPLIAKEFPRVWKSMKGVEYPHNFKERGPIIGNVAISPRGAKWILGVGEAESVFVWRLRDTALEKAKS